MPMPDKHVGIPWGMLLVVCTTRLGISPQYFWKLTFAEFWPLYDAVTPKQERPFAKKDLDKMNERFIRGKSRRISS